ncbi:3-isopropylmalate dehydratase large subunit [Patescibacteria group bacterium]|nr:3-isopropylmalate dehydratase large subunit [Patescibacteria group bacterium]
MLIFTIEYILITANSKHLNNLKAEGRQDMGKTAFQKIIDNHLVRVFPDGRMALSLDWVWCHEITTPNAIIDMIARGYDVVFNPNKIKTMIDHVNPAKDTKSAIQGKIIREWSAKHGIEFLDVGRNGVCHAIIPEKGWISPGQIGIMGDSHTCTHGAFCAFTAGVGTTDLENGIITGLWICPPQKVISVNFNGKLPVNVFAKDLILTFINKIGVKGATNAVLEFGGNIIGEMSMEGRMTIANMAVEAGATSGIMMVDEKTIKYLWPALCQRYTNAEHMLDNFMSWNSDPDAVYDQIIDIDVTNMVPVITNNYSPGDVVNVSALAGKKVNQVYIGSCTNGRLSDLRVAANIFDIIGNKISDSIRCIVVPATQHIYEMALNEGLIDIFVKAGCFVSGPTCGACLGLSCGVLAPGEVCVSTTNRNFPGRMGKDGMVHLTSPATAAFTAIHGVISEPPTNLCVIVVDRERDAPEFEAAIPTNWKEREVKKLDYAQLLAKNSEDSKKDFSGKVFYLPIDNIDTDQIIPAKYLTETKKEEFGKHCLEDAPILAEERIKLHQSQILITGENFGCGSSREHAPWALEDAGIRCVIAPSFARIFENNMFANGLLCITLNKVLIDRLFEEKPDEIHINIKDKEIEWLEKKRGGLVMFNISDYHKELIENGGSVNFMIKLAAEIYNQ